MSELGSALSSLHPLWALPLPCILAGLLLHYRYRLLALALLLGVLYAGAAILRFPEFSPSDLGQMQQEVLWVRGTLQAASQEDGFHRLHLLEVEVAHPEKSWTLPEAVVWIPERPNVRPNFYRTRRLQLDGRLHSWSREAYRLHLRYQKAYFRDADEPLSAFTRLRLSRLAQLRARAAYYLNDTALAVFLPLTIAQHTGDREIRTLFRDTGMAHLLAISGLHMGLILGLLLLGVRFLGRFSVRMLEHPWYRPGTRLLALFGLWGYLTLLGFPVPALRAVTMLTIWILPGVLGLRTPLSYALSMTACGFLLVRPVEVYSLSFQLSFLAVAGILWGLPLQPRSWQSESWLKRGGQYVGASLWVTANVLLFTWPPMVAAFGRLALETFWLNLILIPLLGVIVLPASLLTLLVAALHLREPPEGLWERGAFWVTEQVLVSWVDLLKQLHEWGGALHWEVAAPRAGSGGWLLYYASLFVLGMGLRVIRRVYITRRRSRSPGVKTHLLAAKRA
jgi:ComEC/Rec2-related protein